MPLYEWLTDKALADDSQLQLGPTITTITLQNDFYVRRTKNICQFLPNLFFGSHSVVETARRPFESSVHTTSGGNFSQSFRVETLEMDVDERKFCSLEGQRDSLDSVVPL
jgi:hypothetical protein